MKNMLCKGTGPNSNAVFAGTLYMKNTIFTCILIELYSNSCIFE